MQVRRCFCYWQSAAGIHGTICWGKATEQDVVELAQIFDTVLRSPLAAQSSILDIRAVEAFSSIAFKRLVHALTHRRSAWQTGVGRQAVLHASTFPAGTILGAFQIATSGYEVAAFDEPRAAFEWAGVPKAERDVETLRASLLEPADVVRRVRVALEAEERQLSAAALARALGLSTRSLQRHLAQAGTSIRAERTAHVLARAERLLEGTEYDLEAIAAMLGLSSPGRLVALFRAERKTTPGAWRVAARSK